jgi:hypothetical protein
LYPGSILDEIHSIVATHAETFTYQVPLLPACAAASNINRKKITMCRNIKTLHNFKPPATNEEIRASSLQFVRKLSGFTKPSKANELAFTRAVDQVTQAAHELLQSLVTNAPARDRNVEASKARARMASRFPSSGVTPTT